MSQVEYKPIKRGVSTRTLALVILVVGLGAGMAAYSIGTALAQTNAANNANQLTGSSNQQWFGPGPRGGLYGQGWNHPFNGSFTSFRAATTVANVSVTGYTITSGSHLTVDLAYGGAGSAPTLTVVALTPGLSGSNTVASGWGSSTTVSVALQGGGSLSSTSSCIRVLVVPLTGA